MEIDGAVVEQLRDLFRDGATPSRLMRHIVACHPGQKNWHAIIQDYFREAFGVAIVRGLQPYDDYQHNDLRYWFLNEHVVHEMVENQPWWTPRPNGGATGGWLASLSASSLEDRLKITAASADPDLTNVTGKLTAAEQFAIQRMAAGYNGEVETVRILSRLAERLQQKINKLEGELLLEKERNNAQAARSSGA